MPSGTRPFLQSLSVSPHKLKRPMGLESKDVHLGVFVINNMSWNIFWTTVIQYLSPVKTAWRYARSKEVHPLGLLVCTKWSVPLIHHNCYSIYKVMNILKYLPKAIMVLQQPQITYDRTSAHKPSILYTNEVDRVYDYSCFHGKQPSGPTGLT